MCRIMAHAPRPQYLGNPMVNPGQVKESAASESKLLKECKQERMAVPDVETLLT